MPSSSSEPVSYADPRLCEGPSGTGSLHRRVPSAHESCAVDGKEAGHPCRKNFLPLPLQIRTHFWCLASLSHLPSTGLPNLRAGSGRHRHLCRPQARHGDRRCFTSSMPVRPALSVATTDGYLVRVLLVRVTRRCRSSGSLLKARVKSGFGTVAVASTVRYRTAPASSPASENVGLVTCRPRRPSCMSGYSRPTAYA